MDPATRQRMQVASEKLTRDNGANQVAQYLSKVLE